MAPVTPAANVRLLHNRTIDVVGQEPQNEWFDIRVTNLGNTNTGGTGTPAAFTINKNTISSFADTEFYFAALVPGRYVVAFFLEEPDWVGHFHRFNVLAYTSTVITVTDRTSSPWHSGNSANWSRPMS